MLNEFESNYYRIESAQESIILKKIEKFESNYYRIERGEYPIGNCLLFKFESNYYRIESHPKLASIYKLQCLNRTIIGLKGPRRISKLF